MSIDTRVTLLSSAAASVANIDAAAARQAKVQQELSSGNRIGTAADDPAGAVAAIGLRSALARDGRYGTASADALARLSTADSAYSQSVAVLQKAQTLVLQAANSGANDQNSRDAIAANLDGLRSTLLSLANTGYDGQPVFGGATTGAVAYDSTGSYVGASSTVQRQVAGTVTVSVGSVGSDAFGSGSGSVFALLSTVADSLRGGSGVPSTATADLTSALNRISSAQAGAGTVYNQVTQVQAARTVGDTALKTRLSTITDTDTADAAIRLAAASTAYQAAIQTTASVNRQSLLDFLR